MQFLHKNFNIWVRRSRFRIELFFKLITGLSNLYQKFERIFLKSSNSKIKTLELAKMDFNMPYWAMDIMETWYWYCFQSGLKCYNEEQSNVSFNIMGDPSRFLYRKIGNSYDFARLSYEFLGDNISIGSIIYKFQGIFTIIWNDGSSQFIAIWQNINIESDYLMVLNDNLTFEGGNFLSYWDNIHGGIDWVGEFDIIDNNIKFKSIDKYNSKIH